MKPFRVLTINPKVHSTKVAMYENEEIIFYNHILHEEKQLEKFAKVTDQLEFRKQLIIKELKGHRLDFKDIDIIMARGGLIKPVHSGIYEVNEKMKEDLRIGIMGEHASNLGGLIAADLASLNPKTKAYIANPAVIDEMSKLAKVSGCPKFERKSIFHALSQKSIARKYAKSHNLIYEELNLIVVTIRTGVSIGAHCNGKVIDVNQAFDGEGPFSMERTGTIPPGQLVKHCYSGEFSQEEVEKMITSQGGFYAYLGTADFDEIQKMISDGDKKAEFYCDAFVYQIAKEIGAMYTVLDGMVNAIIFSGDVFYHERFSEKLKSKVDKIAPISVYDHEYQMDALAKNAARIFRGEVEAKVYL